MLARHRLRALADAGAVAVAFGHPLDAGIVDRRGNKAVGNRHGRAGIGRGERVDAARHIILSGARGARNRRQRRAIVGIV